MNITSEQTEKEFSELCALCKFREECNDYAMSKNSNIKGFTVLIIDCPKFEKED
ncbi:MAG: hypothetical protein ACP5OZ_05100 [Candidatus Woesearchaeota archaeon]